MNNAIYKVQTEQTPERLYASPADLVICDIGLPDGNGWELVEKLRAKGR